MDIKDFHKDDQAPHLIVIDEDVPYPPANWPKKNGDKELYRELPGDYYSNSVHVTESGAIGIQCGGTVIVRTISEWHKLGSQQQT